MWIVGHFKKIPVLQLSPIQSIILEWYSHSLSNLPLLDNMNSLNFNQRYLVLCLVQDWVYEENVTLLQAADHDLQVIMRLELALLDYNEQLRLSEARSRAFQDALEHAETANFTMALENTRLLRENRRLQLQLPARRLRRRLTYEEEVAILTDSSDGDTTELDEHPEDIEL